MIRVGYVFYYERSGIMKVTIIDKKAVMELVNNERLYYIEADVRKDGNMYCYLKKVISLRIKELFELLEADNVTFLLIEL